MRAVFLLIALTSLAACQTPCPATPTEPVNRSFVCEDGSTLQVTFLSDSARIVQEGYTTLELPERVSGSGFRYAAEGAELRGRVSGATWTRPGAAETLCQDAR